MTDEELDRVRYKVACEDPDREAFDAYRELVRTNWTPPETEDPDLVEANRLVIEWLNDEAKGKLSELALAAIKAGREMERAKS